MLLKTQIARVCNSFENLVLNNLNLICIIDQRFMVHISQGRYLASFTDNMHEYSLCHLILQNLKVMPSFKKWLKTYDVENTRVGTLAMKMKSIGFLLQRTLLSSTRRHNKSNIKNLLWQRRKKWLLSINHLRECQDSGRHPPENRLKLLLIGR